MQVNIKIDLGSELLALPIAHHHVLQAVFYRLMSENDKGAALHDEGWSFQKREYKLFTFGPIEGHYQINGHKIIFDGTIMLSLHAYDEKIVQTIAHNAVSEGIRFGSVLFTDITCEIRDEKVNSEEIIVSMISPICVYSTDEDGRTRYYSPSEPEFADAVRQNFRRKYTAAIGKEPEGDVSLTMIDVRRQDKYVTRYKDFIIEGYKGTYLLRGKSQYLDFLFQTGLGAKNSQGFGMFKLVEKSRST